MIERDTPTDMRVTFIDKKNNKYWPKWKLQKDCNEEELNKVNLKSMYHDEIVFDLENKNYEELLSRLKEGGITSYSVIDTKSRGFHIHTFFEDMDKHPIELRNEIRKLYIKKYDCDLAKASEVTLISISGRPHFKSGEKAELITDVEGFNTLDVNIVEQAIDNFKRIGTYVKTNESKTSFNDYFETDPFWLYVNKINWSKIPQGCNFNNCILKNLAIAAFNSNKSQEELGELLKPFIKKRKGHPISEFKGWYDKACNGIINEYNYHEVNNWSKQYGTKQNIYSEEYIDAKLFGTIAPELLNKAEDILKNEDPFIFLLKSVGIIHKGDTPIVSKLICSGCSAGLNDRRRLIHSLEVGGSGKGKSNAQTNTCKLFSRSEVITSQSGKATFYKAHAGKLKDHGIIIFDEAEFSEEAQAFERVLTDDKNEVPKHESVSTDRKFVSFEIKEKNVVWKNTTDIPEDIQTLNRYHIGVVDESPEQDNIVFDEIVDIFSNDSFDKEEHEDIVTSKVITDLITESPIKIKIPYGKFITSTDKKNRRTIKKFLKLLHAVTYIYRYQRPINEGYVISTRKDYEIAKIIWDANSTIEQTKLAPMHQQTLALLPDKEAEAVDLNYLANKLEESTSTIRARLKRLGDFGFVNWSKNLETTKKYVYYKTYHAYQGLTIDLPWPDFEDYLLKSIDLPSYLLYYITKGDKETINRIIAPLNDTECDIWNGVKVGKSLSKIDEDREPKPVKIESETSVVSPRQVLGKSIDEREVE